MSKGKKARLSVKNRETVLHRGPMDYCITGTYAHWVMGEAVLTDERFFFSAYRKHTGEYISCEFPLNTIAEVGKVGIPLLTRSILLTTADGKTFRFSVFPMGGWYRALREAVTSFRQKQSGSERSERENGQE